MAGLFDDYGAGTTRKSGGSSDPGGSSYSRTADGRKRPKYVADQMRKRASSKSEPANPEAFLEDLTSTDLKAILSSPDTPESLKKVAKKIVEGKADGKPKDGIVGLLTNNPLTDTMGAVLDLIDKPKRAVVATVDEGLEQLYGYEDGSSWADNVLRKKQYGFGDVWQNAVDYENSQGDGEVFGIDADNKWLGRGVGLVGDIGLDPLTYLGVGLVDDTARASGAAAKAFKPARSDIARRALTEAGEAAKGGDASAVTAFQELAQRVGTGGRVTAAEAEKLGLEGGIRFGGKRIFGDAATSTNLTRPLTYVRSKGMNALGPKLAKVFGADEIALERQLLRSKDTDPVKWAAAFASKDAKKGGQLAAGRFGARKIVELDDIFNELKNSGVDGVTVNRALIGDPDAAEAVGDALPRLRAWLDDVRSEAEIYGYRENYAPRLLTDEARKFLETKWGATDRGSNGARTTLEAVPWFEKKSYQIGDEFGDRVLGSPELVDEFGDVVEDQIQGLISKWGGPEAIYVDDAFQTLPRYVAGVQHRIKAQFITEKLREAGVIVTDGEALGRATTRAAKRAGLDDIAANVDDIARDADEADKAIERIEAKITDTRPEVAPKLEAASSPDAAPAMKLEGDRVNWESRLDDANPAQLKFTDLKNHPGWQRTFKNELQIGLERFGKPDDFEMWPSWMVEAYSNAGKVADDPGPFLRFVDQANKLFKTQAVFSPGFHIRNSMGAYFNSFVAGVDIRSYREFRQLMRQYRKGGYEALPEGSRGVMRTIIESGLMDDGNRYANELASAADGGGRIVLGDVSTARPQGRLQGLRDTAIGPKAPMTKERVLEAAQKPFRHPLNTLNDNPATRASRFAGERIEHFHRGSVAYDTLKKGGSMETAIDKVYQFHFDYGDLSHFESKYMRRLVPFWTWTSRNMPLQLEMALTQPKMYQRFRAVQQSLEQGSTQDPLDPEWLTKSPTNINMSGFDKMELGPFSIGGEGSYLLPDLPFQDVGEKTTQLSQQGPTALLMDAAPIIKTPLETTFGRQLFSGAPLTNELTPIPNTWSFLVPIIRGATGDSVISKNPNTGDWMISNKDAYKIEQALPLLARFRRLAPSEQKYQDRADASWLSFLGFGTRQVTENDRKNSAYGRLDDLQTLRDRLKDQGYDVRSERTRQIEGG
jgi:hypothetical protein